MIKGTPKARTIIPVYANQGVQVKIVWIAESGVIMKELIVDHDSTLLETVEPEEYRELGEE